MNKDIVQGNWKELKGMIKSKWAKLNDKDIDALGGKIEKLSGTLQKKYGYAKDKADKEFSAFKASLPKSSKESKVQS